MRLSRDCCLILSVNSIYLQALPLQFFTLLFPYCLPLYTIFLPWLKVCSRLCFSKKHSKKPSWSCHLLLLTTDIYIHYFYFLTSILELASAGDLHEGFSNLDYWYLGPHHSLVGGARAGCYALLGVSQHPWLWPSRCQ